MSNSNNNGKSGKGSQETIAALTQNQVTSLTGKTWMGDPFQNRILVLLSTTSGSRRQVSQTERAIAMLEALEIPFETLNCTLPEHRERRDTYFEISGIRGEYPQIFLIKGGEGEEGAGEGAGGSDGTESSSTTYLGQFDDMEQCNEKSNMKEDQLSPTDMTWDKIMGTPTNTYNHKGISLDGDHNDDDSSSAGGGGGIYGALDDDDDDGGGGGGNIYADL